MNDEEPRPDDPPKPDPANAPIDDLTEDMTDEEIAAVVERLRRETEEES
jgi:hypothetical protein